MNTVLDGLGGRAAAPLPSVTTYFAAGVRPAGVPPRTDCLFASQSQFAGPTMARGTGLAVTRRRLPIVPPGAAAPRRSGTLNLAGATRPLVRSARFRAFHAGLKPRIHTFEFVAAAAQRRLIAVLRAASRGPLRSSLRAFAPFLLSHCWRNISLHRPRPLSRRT